MCWQVKNTEKYYCCGSTLLLTALEFILPYLNTIIMETLIKFFTHTKPISVFINYKDNKLCLLLFLVFGCLQMLWICLKDCGLVLQYTLSCRCFGIYMTQYKLQITWLDCKKGITYTSPLIKCNVKYRDTITIFQSLYVKSLNGKHFEKYILRHFFIQV